MLGAPACPVPVLLPAVDEPPPVLLPLPPVDVLAPLEVEPDVAPLPPLLVPSPGKLLPVPVEYPSPYRSSLVRPPHAASDKSNRPPATRPLRMKTTMCRAI